MQVKLIYPPSIGIRGITSFVILPYGLGTLVGFLRKNNVAVDPTDINALLRKSYLCNPELQSLCRDLYDLYCNQIRAGHYTGISDRENDLLARRLLDLTNISEDCKLIGISVTGARQMLAALLLAEKIKKEYKTPVVFGGPYVTAFAHMFFQKYDFIDYAVVGEGEVPLLRLLHSINEKGILKDVPSLWYRNESKPEFTGRVFYNIEDQSCPDFDGLPMELYKMSLIGDKIGIPYSLSRGCINECKFCIYENIDGPWQSKSIKKVIQDIAFLKEKYRTDFFLFADANFNLSYKYVEDFCDGLNNSRINIHWHTRGQPRDIDKKLVIKIKKAGCVSVEWGLESGSNKILRAMGKRADIDNQLGILRMVKESGINNYIWLMIKYPYETAADLKKTALLLKNNSDIIDTANISLFTLFPCSDIFTNFQKERIKIKENFNSFLTYSYDFDEIDKERSAGPQKELSRWRQKVIDYNYKYIVSRKVRFPYSLLLRLFGSKLLKPLLYLLERAYFKKRFYRYLHIKIIMRELQYFARYALDEVCQT